MFTSEPRVLRFTRTFKREVNGSGVTLTATMEVQVPPGLPYDPSGAVLEMVDKGGGRLTLQLHPHPPFAQAVGAEIKPVDFSVPASETEVVDMTALIAEEMSEQTVDDRVGAFLTPPVSEDPSGRSILMAGASVSPLKMF